MKDVLCPTCNANNWYDIRTHLHTYYMTYVKSQALKNGVYKDIDFTQYYYYCGLHFSADILSQCCADMMIGIEVRADD